MGLFSRMKEDRQAKKIDKAYADVRAAVKNNNMELAIKYFEEAANGGHKEAILSLIDHYEDHDIDKAYFWIKKYKEKYGKYIWIRHKYNIDFFTPDHDMFEMSFRIIRIKISDDNYECIVTNLPKENFSTSNIKELYNKRWGIETSFKELKYSTALLYFHSKKEELLHQEIYAKLIMYNFSQAIIRHIIPAKKNRQYKYKVNHTMTEQLCALFLRGVTSIDIESIIQTTLLPVRPNRSFKRTKKKERTINLQYRP